MAELSLPDKVVVVLGASSGYGLAAARLLLKQGATVVMANRHETAGETGSSAAGRAIFIDTDVRDHASVMNLAAQTKALCGRIDAWVNSATIGTLGNFTAVPVHSHVDVIMTDLVGTLYGSLAAIEQFQSQTSGGVLINVAADPDSLALPYMVSYAAAKQGVVGMSAALRAEAKAQAWENVHICTVMPGDFSQPEAANIPVTGEMMAPPKVQAAVLDDTADAIVSLITSPKDVTTVKGTHYFL